MSDKYYKLAEQWASGVDINGNDVGSQSEKEMLETLASFIRHEVTKTKAETREADAKIADRRFSLCDSHFEALLEKKNSEEAQFWFCRAEEASEVAAQIREQK